MNLTADQLAQYERDGFLILDKFVEASLRSRRSEY
jgi:hypothetical protein